MSRLEILRARLAELQQQREQWSARSGEILVMDTTQLTDELLSEADGLRTTQERFAVTRSLGQLFPQEGPCARHGLAALAAGFHQIVGRPLHRAKPLDSCHTGVGGDDAKAKRRRGGGQVSLLEL